MHLHILKILSVIWIHIEMVVKKVILTKAIMVVIVPADIYIEDPVSNLDIYRDCCEECDFDEGHNGSYVACGYISKIPFGNSMAFGEAPLQLVQ